MYAPNFDPIAFSIGPLAVHWYGLMYLLGFAAFWVLGHKRAKDAWRNMSAADLEDLLFFGVLGVILGGRLGFCLFYQPEWYLSHPLDVFKVWQGGMSAHGGIVGCIVAIAVFARFRKKTFFTVADFVAPLVAPGLMFGRFGNFINGALWGRAASPDLPWAMVFQNSGTLIARHPSQLYEALLEGIVLFTLVWIYSAKPRKPGTVGALFCMGYGVARFIVEYFREPDSYLGLGLLGLSRGQWLSLPVLLLGVAVWIWAQKQPEPKIK
ncbi:MAG: prolipoprotein diacylglyceryl transferase [Sutterellaceae bacterium]|nr:prolipoprotein diacylglyceryl transferase [Sutterellaceae bacterium]